MRKTAPLVALLGIGMSVVALAQGPSRKELENQVIGWGKLMPPNGNAATPAKASRLVSYSSARQKTIDTFTSWLRQTYVPYGGLPQASIYCYPESRSSSEQVPPMAGVSMMMWAPTYDKSRGVITRAQPASATTISLGANSLPGIEPAAWFNTPTQFYFTMDLDRDGKNVNEIYEQKFAPVVSEVRSKIGDYLVYVTAGRFINVVLIPGNKLPIEPVSRQEALAVAEAGIKRANKEGKNPAEGMKTQLEVVQKMRAKYKDTLSEAAKIRDLQFRIYTFDTTYDVFDDRVLYPIYKVSPTVYAACKKDRPQWVTISFPIPTGGRAVQDKVWKAMTEDFNYEYVYNYYFDPEKVRGKSYQPRH